MADENYPRDLDDDVDPADLAFVQAELAGLTFLDPVAAENAPAPGPMPEWAWERLAAALADPDAATPGPAQEAVGAAARGAGRHVRPPRASRTARWGGGLVAASVAVVAVGLGVSVMRGGAADVAVVAGDAPAVSAVASGSAFGAVPAPSTDSALTTEDLQAPRDFSFAGMVPPAQMLVGSDTAYTSDGLRGQVRSVLRKLGMTSEKQAETVMAEPVTVEAVDVPASGFTTDEQTLRDCITKLTRLAESTALMVDRATFDGYDAGVVVAPMYPTESSPTPSLNRLHVWVVNPDCDITMEIRIRMQP